MALLKYDNRIGIGTVVAVIIAVVSLVTSFAVFGQDAVEARKGVDLLGARVDGHTGQIKDIEADVKVLNVKVDANREVQQQTLEAVLVMQEDIKELLKK